MLPFVFLYGNQEPRSWGGGRSNAPPPPQQAVENPEAQQGAGPLDVFGIRYSHHVHHVTPCTGTKAERRKGYSDPGYMSRKIRKFRTEKFNT